MIELASCPDQYFISDNVVTVKKDHSKKLALDSRIFNRATQKN